MSSSNALKTGSFSKCAMLIISNAFKMSALRVFEGVSNHSTYSHSLQEKKCFSKLVQIVN